jgi:hypothetical protein
MPRTITITDMNGINDEAMRGLDDDRRIRNPLIAIVAPKMSERMRE